jgi:hypothetical protein
MTTDITKLDPAGTLEQVVIQGNLQQLTPGQRVEYYSRVCQSLGLNALTQPFNYITLNGKLTLYARKDATDQLRKIHRVNIHIVSRERIDDVYVVTARATLPDGREDEEIGAVNIAALKGDNLANALMKASCVPLDSEILTREGFKYYHELRIGEEVLAYDVETDTTRWTPLLNVSVFQGIPVTRLVSDKGQFDVLCTPNHSWAIQKESYKPDTRTDGSRGPRGPYKNRKPDRMLVEAWNITKGQKIVLAAPEAETNDSPLTPVEAAILGWAVTDGTIKRVGNSVRIGICQSKEVNFPIIRETVGDMTPNVKELVSDARTRTFPTGQTYDTLPQHWWYLPATISRDILFKAGFTSRADLPRLVTSLSSPARKAMLQAMMLAEGDTRNRFINTDRHLLDAFLILCALEGIATGEEKEKQSTHKPCTYVRKKITRHVAGAFLRLEDAGRQDVWCPTTQYGTWVMRQNGRVMITGNTKAKRRVTLSIVGLGMLDETELETIRDVRPVRVDPQTGELPENNHEHPPEKDVNELTLTGKVANIKLYESNKKQRMRFDIDNTRCIVTDTALIDTYGSMVNGAPVKVTGTLDPNIVTPDNKPYLMVATIEPESSTSEKLFEDEQVPA